MPAVVPRFTLLEEGKDVGLTFPLIIKPVKSFFSVGAYRVDHEGALWTLMPHATLPEFFFMPFRTLFERYTGQDFGQGLLRWRLRNWAASAVMIEARTTGGTCVNRGCLPSKNLIEAEKLVHDARHPRYPGLAACSMQVDFTRLVEQKDEIIRDYRQKNSRLPDHGRGAQDRGHFALQGPGQAVVLCRVKVKRHGVPDR